MVGLFWCYIQHNCNTPLILMPLERLSNIYEQKALTFLSLKYFLVYTMYYEYLPYNNGCHAVVFPKPFYDWSLLNIPKPGFKVPECLHFLVHFQLLTLLNTTHWYGSESSKEQKHAPEHRELFLKTWKLLHGITHYQKMHFGILSSEIVVKGCRLSFKTDINCVISSTLVPHIILTIRF